MKRIGLFYLIRRDISRRAFRTVITIICVGVMAATLFLGSILMTGVNNSLTTGVNRLGADLVVVPEGAGVKTQNALVMGEPTVHYMPKAVEQQVAAVSGVEKVSSQIFIRSLPNAPCCTAEMFLIAFDPETDFTITPWLKTHLNSQLSRDEIIIGSLILSDVDGHLTFFGHEFIVKGVLDRTGMG
ncbi:MAG: multidrug ABC transporter substrate-binding protein, partial [Candidatus Bathyarchaeota archaeon]